MQNKKTQYYLNKEEEKGQQDVFILNILFEQNSNSSLEVLSAYQSLSILSYYIIIVFS